MQSGDSRLTAKMTPEWLHQLLWFVATLLGGSAVWYFLSERSYHLALWSGYAALIVVITVVALTIRNNLLAGEAQREAKPVQQTAPSASTASSPSTAAVVNIPNQLANEGLAGGIYLEGRRNNVLVENCIEAIVAQHPEIAKLGMSSVAPDFKQATFDLEPKRILTLEFNGQPVLNRQDYTFSFVIFATTPNAYVDLLTTIQSDNGETSLKYDMATANPFQDVKAQNIKTYRPQISNFFPEIPRFLKGRVRITNTSDTQLVVSVFLPMIEEGLFASSLIPCGRKRGGESLSYEAKGNMPSDLDAGGTISFFFSPSWNADRLTPGISPHFLNWTDQTGANGIKIIADSRDHGKLKAIIASNGKATVLPSDIRPLKGERYSVHLRFAKQRADLLINAKYTSSVSDVQLPKGSALGQHFYIGSNPVNEDDGVFATMSDFKVFAGWLDDERIKREVQEVLSRR